MPTVSGGMRIRSSSTWKLPQYIYIRSSSAWKQVLAVYVRSGNAWKLVYNWDGG